MAICASSAETTSTISTTHNTEQRIPQSIDHIHNNYGRYLKADIMAQDAFYALQELFEFSAASIDQLMTLFKNTIQSVLKQRNTETASELLLLKAHVDEYRDYVNEMLEIVRARGCRRWPRVTEKSLRAKADIAAEQLEDRYQRLARQCSRLSDHCDNSISIAMSLTAQRQSDEAINQGNRFGKLSVLAYFYIPVTLAASFYGVDELHNSSYSKIQPWKLPTGGIPPRNMRTMEEDSTHGIPKGNNLIMGNEPVGLKSTEV
ncbi:hypothetical protein CMQ_7188 [Grosmannia clavigera kw1407]|uniref:Uncharacterized protein n=1 Tax=Grosmannia clavigera (strain kw1407 / UAMH 11150) TaxID=655863 RepID=F0XPP4_GROCL|nr:uncharacterized protein CMQ_7188 [Grosmannia clavigera kw1407]EFX00186.1 hypothetical protein CMQ_7188 [Grosmannia clavigera kw1407]